MTLGYLWVGFNNCLSSCSVWFFGVGPEEVRSRVRCSMAGALLLGSDQLLWGSDGCNDSRGHDSSWRSFKYRSAKINCQTSPLVLKIYDFINGRSSVGDK